MTRIEELLSRTLLVRERTMPRDIVSPPATSTPPPDDPAQAGPPNGAAEDLRTLCQTLVTHTPPTQIADFVTDQVPEPRSALVLACVLQLTDTDEGARFWWQCAAGAGQAAAYCLYLHHLSLGEEDTADWWHRQTDDVQPSPQTPAPEEEPHALAPRTWYAGNHRITAASTTNILRILRHLSKHTARSQSTAVTNLMAYIPGAVTAGYLSEPDTELPLPGPGFAHRINALLTTTDPLRSRTTPTHQDPHGTERTSPRSDTANTVQRA